MHRVLSYPEMGNQAWADSADAQASLCVHSALTNFYCCNYRERVSFPILQNITVLLIPRCDSVAPPRVI